MENLIVIDEEYCSSAGNFRLSVACSKEIIFKDCLPWRKGEFSSPGILHFFNRKIKRQHRFFHPQNV